LDNRGNCGDRTSGLVFNEREKERSYFTKETRRTNSSATTSTTTRTPRNVVLVPGIKSKTPPFAAEFSCYTKFEVNDILKKIELAPFFTGQVKNPSGSAKFK